MNELEIKGSWQEAFGKIKQKYGEVLDDDIVKAEGLTDEVIGKLRNKLGKSENEMRSELDDLLK